MRKMRFYSDMALDSIEQSSHCDLVQKKRLSSGIVKSTINLKNSELAKKIGRKQGVYVTFDCVLPFFESVQKKDNLTKVLASAIKEMTLDFGSVKPSVLIVGLGNEGMTADSLGPKAVSKIIVTRHLFETDIKNGYRSSVSSISPNVLGETGVQSFDIVKGVVDAIKPNVVIVIDTLCTNKTKRLYSSFQLSTAGISPGSGVGEARKGFDFSTLKVPVLAIGVPLVANMREVIRDIMRKYCHNENRDLKIATLESIASEQLDGNIIVAPKEIDYVVAECADVIAEAINLAFCGRKTKVSLV